MRKLTWFGLIVVAWITEALAGVGIFLTAKVGDIPLGFWDAMALGIPAVFVSVLVMSVIWRLAERG